MNYNREWLIEQYQNKKRFRFLFFWGHQPHLSGKITASCFSQWWPASFVVDDISYRTAEHWMMAQKARLFNDNETFKKIILARSPNEAKTLGRQVKGFQDELWEKHRYQIVYDGSLQKFAQHPELRQYLISTRDQVLVEASPVDRIWGIGLTADDERAHNPILWRGLNLLGFVLMEVRDHLS